MEQFFIPKEQPKATIIEVRRIQEIQKRLDEIHNEGGDHGAGPESEYIKLSNMECQLQSLYDWGNEIFIENGKKGVKDILGKVRLNPEYDEIIIPLDFFSTKSSFAVCKSGKWGLIASDGSNRITCNPQYDNMMSAMTFRSSDTHIDLYIVEKDGKKGLIKENGDELVPCVLDEIEHQYETIVLLKDGKVGFVSENLNYDIAWPDYDEIDFAYDDIMLPARKGNIWGRINRTSGDFEVDAIEPSSLNILETIDYQGVKIDLCSIEISGKLMKRFRFKVPVDDLLNGMMKDCLERNFSEFDAFINEFIHTDILLSDGSKMPLAGHVIPQTKDFGNEKNLPTTDPLFKDFLEQWIDDMAIKDFYQQVFDIEIKSLMKTPPKMRKSDKQWYMIQESDFSPIPEDFDNDIKFPIDDAPGWSGQSAVIRNNQWYIRPKYEKEYGGFDEIRGVYPGRLRVRIGNKWSDVETGAIGQTDDEGYLDAFYHLCNYLDNLLGNTEGCYIASEIAGKCKDIEMSTIEYPKPNYEVIDTINIYGLIIRKIKNSILADAVDAPKYLYVLDKPLMAIARKLKTVDLNLMWGSAFGDESCSIEDPREFLQNIKLTPRSGDVCLYGQLGRNHSNGELAKDIRRCYNEMYSFDDVVIERNGKFGLRDTTGHLVLSPEYDSATPVSDHHRIPRGAIVTLNGRMAFAQRSMPIPAEDCWYDDVELFFYDIPKYIVRRNGKVGLIDVYNNLLVPCEMDEISKPTQGCSLIRKGNLWGLILENEDIYIGKPVVVEPQFEEWDCQDMFVVTKDGVNGYINEYGVFTLVAEERCVLLDEIFHGVHKNK